MTTEHVPNASEEQPEDRAHINNVPEKKRGFIADLLIVVFGVILGLAATELMSSFNTSRDVSDMKQALHWELAVNFQSLDLRHQASDCVTQRIKHLREWVQLQKIGKASAFPRNIGRPGFMSARKGLWDVSKTGEIASKVRFDERLKYAQIYDIVIEFDEVLKKEADLWNEVSVFSGIKLTPRELSHVEQLISQLDSTNIYFKAFYPTLVDEFHTISLKPAATKMSPIAEERALCRPL